jgi:hypothetical protein
VPRRAVEHPRTRSALRESLMSSRFLASLGALGVSLLSVASAHFVGQSPGPSQALTASAKARLGAKSPVVERTPDGRPDLQGNWSFATVTPLERPRELGQKEVLTNAETVAYERQAAERNDADRRSPRTDVDVELGYNNFWYDRGTRIVATKRTSLVTDPPDGRVPPVTAEGRALAIARAEVKRRLPEGPEDRPLGERCLLLNAGPPMLPGPYNNNFQLVRTREKPGTSLESRGAALGDSTGAGRPHPITEGISRRCRSRQ